MSYGFDGLGGGFADPIVGPDTKLLIPAIQSPNFTMGVTGWTINKDGSAEFNNLTVRGTFFGTDYIINANGVFFYSGTPAHGNLIISLAGVAGTDGFSNTYPQGLSFTGGGESLVMGLTGGSPLIYAVTGLPETNGSAIQVIKLGSGTAAYEFMQILSAEDSTQNDIMLMGMGGSSADGTQKAQHNVQYKDSAGVFHMLMQIFSTVLNLNIELAQVFTADTSAMISQTNVTTTSNSGFIMQVHFNASSSAMKVRVNGDSSSRFIMAADGSMQWGPGSAGTDTLLKRLAAGVLAVTTGELAGQMVSLDPNTPTQVEAWHSGTSLLAATWSATTAFNYRKMPDGTVMLQGQVVTTNTALASGATVLTLPVNYRPLQQVIVWTTQQGATPVSLTIATTGVVQAHFSGTLNVPNFSLDMVRFPVI